MGPGWPRAILSGTHRHDDAGLCRHESGFSRRRTRKLFDSVAVIAGFRPGRNYDVAADGRFVMIKDANFDRPVEVTIALNLREELKRRLIAKQ